MRKLLFFMFLAMFWTVPQEVKAYYDDDGTCVRVIDEYMVDDLETISVDGFRWVSPGTFTQWSENKDFVMKIKGTINVDDIKALWRFSLIGNLSTIDMGDVVILGDEIPDFAFWDEEVQNDNSNGITASIKLKRIVLPKNTKRIGKKAFANAYQLSEVVFPEGLECIGDSAFYNCCLENVELPNSCINFEGGYHFARNFYLKKVRLAEGMDILPVGFLSQCILLEEVNIPSTVRHISDYALNECRSVRYLNLPPYLESIGERAFFCMDFLYQLNFPATMKFLGNMSCLFLTNLCYIYCEAPVPPECEMVDRYFGHTFGASANVLGVTPEYLEVYVPKGSAEAYRKAIGWDYFMFIKETDEFPDASVHEVVVDDNADGDLIFDLDGRVVKNPQEGHLYVKNRKKFIYTGM